MEAGLWLASCHLWYISDTGWLKSESSRIERMKFNQQAELQDLTV